MSVSGVGAGAQGASSLTGNSSSSAYASAVQNFMDYMKETPAQQMEDAWLHAHGLTRQELAKMSPEKQAAIMRQMQQDIELQLKQKAEKAAGKTAVTS